MSIRMKSIVGGIVAATVLTAGGVAYAETASPTTTTAPAQPPKAGGRGADLRTNVLGRVIRGDIEALGKDNNVVKLHVERGTVSGVNGGKFTLTGPDGKKVAMETDADTRIRPKTTTVNDLNGKQVTVVSQKKDGDAYVAAGIVARQPNPRRQKNATQPGTTQPGTTQPNAQQGNPPGGF